MTSLKTASKINWRCPTHLRTHSEKVPFTILISLVLLLLLLLLKYEVVIPTSHMTSRKAILTRANVTAVAGEPDRR